MAEAATAQIESLISQLQHEGLLDEQFSMLITLQDDDSPDFVVEVVQLYFEDSVSKIDKIGEMLSTPSPDFNELDQLVHQFKGSSASLGAQMIAQLCVKLREQCQIQNIQGCIALVGQIRQAYDLLKSRLELFIQLENHRKQFVAAGAQ